MKLLELPDALRLRRQCTLFDDFLWYISPHVWTSLATDGGTSVAAGTSAAAGTVILTTGATDNNEAAIATTNKPYLFASEKTMRFEANSQYAEAATSACNMCAGFSSVMNTANMMLDDGAGPAASFSGAIIYKVDGGTVWRFRTSIGSTNIDTISQHTAGGSTAQVLSVEVRTGSYGYVEAVPFLNGLQMLDANNKPIKHTFVTTSAAAMQAGVYVKAGGANSEVVTVDYLAVDILR